MQAAHVDRTRPPRGRAGRCLLRARAVSPRRRRLFRSRTTRPTSSAAAGRAIATGADGQADLSSRESPLRGGARGRIRPGNAEESRLYRRVAGLEQPDAGEGAPLTADEIAAVKQWIDEGAKWDAAGFAEWTRSAARSPRWRTGSSPPGANLLGVQAAGPGSPSLPRRARFTNPIDRFSSARRAHGADSRRREPIATPWSAAPISICSACRPRRRRSTRLSAIARRTRGSTSSTAARVAALRRTVRPALARHRALRGLRRLRVPLASPQRLAVPRLRDQVVQRRQTVRPVPDRTDRRR